MAQKKSGSKNSSKDSSNASSKKNSGDMTRIEDLSSFLHQDDPEVEAFFNNLKNTDISEEEIAEASEEETSLDDTTSFETSAETDLDTNEPNDDLNSQQTDYELSENTTWSSEVFSDPDTILQESDSLNENFSLEESNPENSFETSDEIVVNEINSDDLISEEKLFNEYAEPVDLSASDEADPSFHTSTLNLSEFKQENIDYNQTTSFGHLPSSANPAFSIEIYGIDSSDSDQIIEILEEFNLLKNNSEKDYRLSLSHGHLLISQINEYLVITLATKLKRFGGHIQMGPSDLIFNSKIIQEKSPRGLHTKRYKDQVKKGSISTNQQTTNDKIPFFINFPNSESEFDIIEHLGVVTTSQLIEEDDLKRSAHAQKMLDESEEFVSNEDRDLYQKYAELLDHNKDKLIETLTAKALLKKANALNNLQFHINTQSIKHKNMIIIQAHANADLVEMRLPNNNEGETSEN